MQAASLGIPFQPVRGLFGTDVATAGGFATVRDPYSGEDIYVVPRIRPDWAVLHVHEADEQGNARLYGSPGYDLVMAEAAAHVILTQPSREFSGNFCIDDVVLHQMAGVREYWLIDPSRKQAEFYLLGPDGIYASMPVGEDGIFRSHVLDGFWLKVDWLWQDPLPTLMSVLKEWGFVK